jgi:hypothetical protein
MHQGTFACPQARQRLTGDTTLPYPSSSLFSDYDLFHQEFCHYNALLNRFLFPNRESTTNTFPYRWQPFLVRQGIIPEVSLNYSRKSGFETFFEK